MRKQIAVITDCEKSFERYVTIVDSRDLESVSRTNGRRIMYSDSVKYIHISPDVTGQIRPYTVRGFLFDAIVVLDRGIRDLNPMFTTLQNTWNPKTDKERIKQLEEQVVKLGGKINE